MPKTPTFETALAQHQSGQCGSARVWESACTHLSESLGCTRVSLWLYSAQRDRLDELCLLDSRTGRFSSGMSLAMADFHPYFEALEKSELIDAPMARTHPATACFGDAYFLPADIHSLLDSLVFDGGEPVAVICCEHCGEPKQWSMQDQAALAQVCRDLGQAFGRARATHRA